MALTDKPTSSESSEDHPQDNNTPDTAHARNVPSKVTAPGLFTYGQQVPSWTYYVVMIVLVITLGIIVYNNLIYYHIIKQKEWLSYPNKSTATALHTASNMLWPFPGINLIMSAIAQWYLQSANKLVEVARSTIDTTTTHGTTNGPLIFNG